MITGQINCLRYDAIVDIIHETKKIGKRNVILGLSAVKVMLTQAYMKIGVLIASNIKALLLIL